MIDQFVQEIIDWLLLIHPINLYLFFFAISYLENIMPPVPGDVLIVFTGYLAAQGLINLYLIWGLTVFASVVGFMSIYCVGRKLEQQISANRHDHFFLKFINYEYLNVAKSWMSKYGQLVILGNRFLAGTRSVISLTAGITDLNLSKTIVNSLISSALWNALLIALGWLLKENWIMIGEYLSTYGRVVLIVVILLVISRLIYVRLMGKNAQDSV